MATLKSETPLMRQYNEIKQKHPGTILLFRVGDFYETFSDDAILVSRELGITLTKRNNGGDMTPLAGFPFHALDTYLPKLIRKGHRVAVCEQTEDPAEAKARKSKVVEREVTEITTPGVTLSDTLLDQNRNNYLLSIHIQGDELGVAFCDVSTGELGVTEIPFIGLGSLLSTILPSEIITSRKHKNSFTDRIANDVTKTWIEDWVYEGEYGYELLKEHFRTHSLKGFGVEEQSLALIAAGALLHYVRENQKSTMAHIRRIYRHDVAGFMVLDASTKRNLELTSSLHDGRQEGTLISILDETRTAMGARLLRRWLMQPLRDLSGIQSRLEAVDEFVRDHSGRSELREGLGRVSDVERLLSRIMVGRSSPRDLEALLNSLDVIDPLKHFLQSFHSTMVTDIQERLDPLPEVRSLIGNALHDDPPSNLRDGGVLRDGYHPELDELRDISRNGKQYIARIQKELVSKTGIHSLKLGYNKVFGYYIEVTNAHKERIPEDFIRKQTLVNAERYITPELKEIEEKILSAEERIIALEYQLFAELCEQVSYHSDRIQQNASAIARLDVIQGLAEVAVRNQYTKPEVNESTTLDIRAGRHPVVEKLLPMGEPFIPNDVLLDNESRQIMIITGPNMAGKSVILRQTGLIVLLAQVGSFVPASKATIGLVDKIFTRVGASDNLAAGESTFLVEMNEAANILNNATPRSLILLDEVGRGTSTFDGLSIAWSLAEYLHNQPDVAAKTLFATHYHELNELASLYERIFNCNVQVQEHKGKVIFLRKLIEGGADHSYGIQVASMAGLPEVVISRAREILQNLEKHSLDITNKNGDEIPTSDIAPDESPTNGHAPTSAPTPAPFTQSSRSALKAIEKQPEIPQLSLFAGLSDPRWDSIRTRLEGVEPNRMTPIEALLLLTELKRELNR
jgi:DNA mismatch repair protein MutS